MEKDEMIAWMILGLCLLIGGGIGYGVRYAQDRSAAAAVAPKIVFPNVSFAITPDGKPIAVNSNWSFMLGDYDGDGILDLYIIKQSGTGTNTTEVHVLKGPQFQEYLLHTGTSLHETPNYIIPQPVLPAEKQ